MRLRDVTDEDLPSLFEHQREPEANRMVPREPRDWDAFTVHWRTSLANAGITKKAIVVDGAVAGNVVAWTAEDKRLVGYWIGKAFWGHGIATAALAELVSLHERSRPLHAYVALENAGSRRVLQKCGFRQEGDTRIAPDGVLEALMRLDAPPST